MRILIADTHLCVGQPARTSAFVALLVGAARQADEVYLLGDIFDVWLGDDTDDEVAAVVVAALADLTAAGIRAYILPGNRDFLIGARFCRRTQCRLLADFYVAEFGQQRYLLTHGDLFCGDVAYLRIRRTLRWLAAAATILPLSWRRRVADMLRGQSQKRRQSAMVDVAAATAALRKHRCFRLIHGHTHVAAEETWQDGGESYTRYCLPDWENTPGAYVQIDDDDTWRWKTVDDAG